MKKCLYCNCEIDDSAVFCFNCGGRQETDAVESVAEKASESTDTKKYVEMRKGFAGFWWNLIHCAKLNKKDQKSVMIKTGIGCAVLMVLVICLTVSGFVIAEKIESSKRYTYMVTEDFIERWNSAAAENPEGITNGVKLDSDDLVFVDLSDTDEIDIDTRGADIISIAFKAEAFTEDGFDRYKKIEEFLEICIPDSNEKEISAYLEEYKKDEAQRIQSGVVGFKVDFEEIEKPEEFEMHIKVNYAYTNNIVKCGVPWGGAFDCTLDDFKANHNKNIEAYFADDPVAKNWTIYNFAEFGTEEYSNGEIVQQGFIYCVNGVNIASVYLFVDSQSEKITMIEYQTFYDTSSLTDEEFEICFKTLPTCILTALGFSEYGLYDNYILEPINKAPEMLFYQGVRTQGAGVAEKNISILGYRPCSKAFFEAEKSGNVDEYIKELEQSKESLNTEPATEIQGEVHKDEAEEPTTEVTAVIETTNPFAGKTFVNAGDFSPVCDYSLVNSVTFGSDKVTLQINLMEFVVSVEADYKVEGNTVILGEVLTEAGDVMIEEGSQFIFDADVLTVNGFAERFVLSGWSCPYQFNDGEDFIEA